MSSTFSSLKFELIGVGEQSGTWGTTTNTNIGTAIEQAIVGMATLDSSDFVANVCTLTLANTNAAQDARALAIKVSSGSTSAAGTLNVPAIQKPYLIINDTAHNLTVKVTGQTGVTVPAGLRTVVYNDGTDVGAQVTFLTSLALGTALPVTSGGTGATAASGARTNLGASTVGSNLFTLTNPNAITFLRLNADNTVSALSAADFRTATGSGTVTSVGGTGTTSGLTLSGTVTSSGSLTLSGNVNQVTTTNFTILEEGGKLVIKSGGVTIFSITTAGAIVAKDNVTAYGTP